MSNENEQLKECIAMAELAGLKITYIKFTSISTWIEVALEAIKPETRFEFEVKYEESNK